MMQMAKSSPPYTGSMFENCKAPGRYGTQLGLLHFATFSVPAVVSKERKRNKRGLPVIPRVIPRDRGRSWRARGGTSAARRRARALPARGLRCAKPSRRAGFALVPCNPRFRLRFYAASSPLLPWAPLSLSSPSA